MAKVVIFSRDSSYGGVSFIANKITDTVILLNRNRKDFDAMIRSKMFYSDDTSKAKQIIQNAQHLIVFGVISLAQLVKLGTRLPRKWTLVITDTTFLKQKAVWNAFIKTHKPTVLIMPDLIEFLDKDIPFRPYYQHIDIQGIQQEKKSLIPRIAHSPGLKFASDLKGTTIIQKALAPYEVDVIHGETWEGCMRRKSRANFFVDQIAVNHYRYTGGLGKSGCEAMLLGCLTISGGKPPVTEPFFPNPPVVIADQSTLRATIEYYIQNTTAYDEKIQEQRHWAEKYLGEEFVKTNLGIQNSEERKTTPLSKFGPDFYDYIHANPSKWRVSSTFRHFEELKEYFTGTILDIACGLGGAANYTNLNYTGVDFSPVAIEYARKNCTNLRAVFYLEDIADFMQADHPADTVILSEILEHVDNPLLIATYALRMYKKVLICTLPVNMPMEGHIKGTWSEKDITNLLGKKNLVKLEQGCRTKKGVALHWHVIYRKDGK